MKRILYISVTMLAMTCIGAQRGDKEKLNAEFAQAISSAFRERNFKPAEDLLEQGVDVNTREQFGGTLLMAAVYYGQDGLVQKLLTMGADINARTKDGSTALSEAIKSGSLDMIKMLIKNGANPLLEKDEKTASEQLRKGFVHRFSAEQIREAAAVLKELEALEQEYRKTRTVKQMQLPKKAIQAGLRGQMGELGKEVEKYL